jgi:hypothetical protein
MPRPQLSDMTGQTFGRLTATSKTLIDNKTRYICQCSCGASVIVRPHSLSSGNTQSCGCFQRERFAACRKGKTDRHGLSNTPEYDAWVNMLHRCENPKHKQYLDYGGRGITVSNEWRDFFTFYRDMGPRPSDLHSLDRIDNDLGYVKENCRWATRIQQQRNLRSNLNILWKGRSQPVSAWAEELGIPQNTLRCRLFKSEWTLVQAFTTPVREERRPYSGRNKKRAA